MKQRIASFAKTLVILLYIYNFVRKRVSSNFNMAAIPNVAVPSSQKKPAKKREIQFTDEMDEILKRITEIKNVAGVVVVNSEGITVKSTLDNVLSVQVSSY